MTIPGEDSKTYSTQDLINDLIILDSAIERLVRIRIEAIVEQLKNDIIAAMVISDDDQE